MQFNISLIRLHLHISKWAPLPRNLVLMTCTIVVYVLSRLHAYVNFRNMNPRFLDIHRQKGRISTNLCTKTASPKFIYGQFNAHQNIKLTPQKQFKMPKRLMLRRAAERRPLEKRKCLRQVTQFFCHFPFFTSMTGGY